MQNVCGQAKEEVFLMSSRPFQLPGRRAKGCYFTTERFEIFEATKKQLTEDLEAIAESRLKPFSRTDVGRLIAHRAL